VSIAKMTARAADRSIFGCSRRHRADDHLPQSLPQFGNIFRTVQLLELPLGFAPERRRLGVNAASFFRQLDEAASAVCR